MDGILIHVYARYETEDDSLWIVLKDKQMKEFILSSADIDKPNLKEEIGAWILNKIKDMVDTEKKFEQNNE